MRDRSINGWRRTAGWILLLSVAGGISRADSFPRQPAIRILHYTFDVTLGDASDEMSVKDKVELELLRDGVEGIDLNLCNLIQEPQAPDRENPCLQSQPRVRPGSTPPPGEPPNSLGRGMTVTGVAAGATALTFEHRNNLLHVHLPSGLHAGSRLAFTVSYHGTPANGIFIGRNRYGDRVWFTDNWPNKARNWLATIDHISVKATKTISVTAPRTYHVLSNGVETEEMDLADGMRRTTWDETVPIPSWQYSLGVGQMAVEYLGSSRGVAFTGWVFPQDRDLAFKAFGSRTASIFEFYSDHIGPYSYEKLAHLEATGGGGATEPATSIFYYGNSFGAVAHEMAHQWFGDAVTECDWDHVWLSEGFATYFALLYTEHQEGHDAFLEGVRRARDAAVSYAAAHPEDTVVHRNLAHDSDVFSNSTQIYQEGAMVLQMLRGVLGDDVFWSGVRLYYSRFRDKSASSDDLRHAMEDACYAAGDCPGDHQDLSWFFNEWLNRGGILRVKGSWHYDPAAKQLRIVLAQTPSPSLYRMPVPVTIETAPGGSPAGGTGSPARGRADAGILTRTLLVDGEQSTLTIPLEQAPVAVRLDPDVRVPMMQASFTPD